MIKSKIYPATLPSPWTSPFNNMEQSVCNKIKKALYNPLIPIDCQIGPVYSISFLND